MLRRVLDTWLSLNKCYLYQFDEELWLNAINTELHSANLRAIYFIWLITHGWHSAKNPILNGYSNTIASMCDTWPWKFTYDKTWGSP